MSLASQPTGKGQWTQAPFVLHSDTQAILEQLSLNVWAPTSPPTRDGELLSVPSWGLGHAPRSQGAAALGKAKLRRGIYVHTCACVYALYACVCQEALTHDAGPVSQSPCGCAG